MNPTLDPLADPMTAQAEELGGQAVEAPAPPTEPVTPQAPAEPQSQGFQRGTAYTSFFDKPTGRFVCNVVIHAQDATAALDELVALTQYASNRYHLTIAPEIKAAPVTGQRPAEPARPQTDKAPTGPARPAAPPTVPAEVGAIESIVTVKHMKKNKDFLMVTTPQHPDGMLAFGNIIPKEWSFESWKLWQAFGPPDGWDSVRVGMDKNGKPIVDAFIPIGGA